MADPVRRTGRQGRSVLHAGRVSSSEAARFFERPGSACVNITSFVRNSTLEIYISESHYAPGKYLLDLFELNNLTLHAGGHDFPGSTGKRSLER